MKQSGPNHHIGFDPLTTSIGENPFPAYAALRAHAPVYLNSDRDVWAIARFDDVQRAARDWKTFSSAGEGVDLDASGRYVWGAGNFLDIDPPRHDALRDIVQRAFSPTQVRLLERHILSRADCLLESLTNRGECDLVRDFSWRLPMQVSSSILGIPAEDEAVLTERLIAAGLQREAGSVAIPTASLEAADWLQGYLEELVAKRRRHPRGDVVSAVANAVVDGVPLDREAVGLAHIVLSASVDTVSAVISNGLLATAQLVKERAHLLREPERVAGAVEEILRCESPVQFDARTTTREVEVCGERIPAGARVVLLFASANRDERRWPDAETLDLFREPKRHLAFGEGIHFCLGASLARLEGSVALREFWRRFPQYRIIGAPERATKHNVRGLLRLPADVSPLGE